MLSIPTLHPTPKHHKKRICSKEECKATFSCNNHQLSDLNPFKYFARCCKISNENLIANSENIQISGNDSERNKTVNRTEVRKTKNRRTGDRKSDKYTIMQDRK